MVFFVVNNNRRESCEADVFLPYEGEIQEWDPLTGKIWKISCDKGSVTAGIPRAKASFHAHWEKAGSHLYFIPKERRQVTEKRLPEWADIRLNSPNVLTLDVCRYRMAQGEWSPPMEVWEVQRNIRKQLGEGSVPVELIFVFRAEEELKGCFLALEQPWRFRINCNGLDVNSKPEGWFLDRAFEKVSLPVLPKGISQLLLRCEYQNNMELENCYLLGDFGVTVDRKLVKKPARLKIGDWTSQGLYHYCGSVTYLYHYLWSGQGRAVLKLGEYAAVCLTVTIGNRLYGMPWRLEEALDVTEGLVEGDNLIEVEVMGSPRNMLGPLHYRELYPKNTKAACFRPAEKDYISEYQVVPYGLFKAPIIEERG